MERSGESQAGRPAFLRGLTEPRLSRRQFVRSAAAAGVGLSTASLLSACGIAGTRDTGWEAGFNWSDWWKQQQRAGTLDFANWPLYIDQSHGTHPSLDKFTQDTGISVSYRPVIQ